MNKSFTDRTKRVDDFLERAIRDGQFPGIQYVVVDSNGPIFEYDGGWADIGRRLPMKPTTTMMAYSMTKTFTAAAVMQLVERGKLSLDDPVARYFPSTPYGESMTIRHLLDQTSGIPNPIPLTWVHSSERHASFDEKQELGRILKEHPEPEFPPGDRYSYSNISYWILGEIIERVSGQKYPAYMRDHVFGPLGLSPSEAAFTIPDTLFHAKGYLDKWSFMNLIKGFIIDKEYIGEYEGPWLHINNHHLNGPGFGGLIATARSVAQFLRDQLRDNPVLMTAGTRKLFFTQQRTNAGDPIDMTLGWHIKNRGGVTYYYKEGGGGGYHAEMRVYPERHIATVIMVNETSGRCVDALDELDQEFLN